MNNVLSGLRIIEGAAFVAAPLCGMTLAQLGAEVIRFDPLEGGLDSHRWPLSPGGNSLYWAGLNKGKRSIAVDTHTPEGRELVVDLVTAPGASNGIFVTNFPASGWLGYDNLRARRDDLIMLNILGNPDGTSAVDYTVNCATGFPFATGPTHGHKAVNPVNHVLPAWDAITGITAALGVVAAERHRRLTGVGQYIKLPLADVAMAMVGNLGYIGRAQVNGDELDSVGNYLYGAFGHDFATRDERYVYVVAVTKRQWQELVRTTGLTAKFALVEDLLEVDLGKEGDRYSARETISAVLDPWFGARTLDEVRGAFDGTHVCWGPYQTFLQLVDEDPRCSVQNPMFSMVEQPGIGTYLVPGSPLGFSAVPRGAPRRAPILGEHTDEVLSEVLELSDAQIGRLREKRVVAGPVGMSG